MCDKKKSGFAAPMPKLTTEKSKRPSTVSLSSTLRNPNSIPTTTRKEKPAGFVRKTLNTTNIVTEEDNFEEDYRQIAYGRFSRQLLEDCLVKDKIEREQTKIDIQMAQLAARFEDSMEVLNKTSNRLKEINFLSEQQRLLEMKRQDCSLFYEKMSAEDHSSMLADLTSKGEACLDQLQTKNVDFGYSKESGHKQLLDAVNEAIQGLEDIKKQSKLDMPKFEDYHKAGSLCVDLEADKAELESLKKEFDAKFPKLCERLLLDSSEKISVLLDRDVDDK